jgi:tetratricopeptide (TPR) repeat protein
MLRALVQNERWDEILDGKTLPVYEKPREIAWRNWAVGVSQVAKNDAGGAKVSLEAMDEALDLYQDKVKQAVPAELRLARRELSAQLLLTGKKKKVSEAIARLEKVAERERALLYTEPPYYPRPVSEVIGKVALEAGRLDAAAKAYRRALEQYPGSQKATAGLKEIGRRQGTGGASALD